MGLFNALKKQKSSSVGSKNNTQGKISFPAEHLEFTLDNVIRFLDAFCAELPDEWCHLFISQEFEHGTSYTSGKIKIEIILGNWWNNLLYQYPDLMDYMNGVFLFDSQRNSFTFSGISTGVSNGAFPKDAVNNELQRFLDAYESKHPWIRFQRFSWGAQLTRGL